MNMNFHSGLIDDQKFKPLFIKLNWQRVVITFFKKEEKRKRKSQRKVRFEIFNDLFRNCLKLKANLNGFTFFSVIYLETVIKSKPE